MHNPQTSEPQQRCLNGGLVDVKRATNQAVVHRFIHTRFQQAYQADIQDFLPNQLVLLNSQGQLNAALGYQSAAAGPLYLEQYLTQPIDQIIALRLDLPGLARQQIVEIGNLAAISAGATRQLILQLAPHFQQQAVRWLVMTATTPVQQSFQRLGIAHCLHSLANVQQDAVSGGESDWGQYYHHHPTVLAVDLQTSIATLRQSPVMVRLLEQAQPPLSDTLLQLPVREDGA